MDATSEEPTVLAATETTGTTASYTHTSASSTSAGISGNKATLATAVAVDDRTVVVADPVEAGESEDQKKKRLEKRKQTNVFAVAGLLVLLTVIVLSVLLTQRGKDKTNIPSNGSALDNSTTLPPKGDSSDSGSIEDLAEDYQQRKEDMISVLEFLYEDLEGGVEVFEASSPFASEDRIAALEWLVKEDPSKISIPSQDDSDDYEQQVYKVRQRYVLALLYMATNGKNWDKQYNFLTSLDECQWTSIYTQELSPDDTTYVEDEFNVKGAICNDRGQLEKLAMWWNSMSGTLPHELSLFSETLKELNLAGGSISGSIPFSITKLKNLESLSLSDNCIAGDLPVEMNPIDMPKLAILAVHMNNYGITAYSENMGSFCDGNGGKIDGVVALAMDCPPEEFAEDDTHNSTLADVSPWGCDCCICCYPENYQCQDLVSGESWTSHFLDEISDNGFPKGFDTQCVSSEQESWIAANCPCLINVTVEPIVQPFMGSCTTDCSQEGTIPSYDFGS